MIALSYLLRTQIKNKVLSLKKKPAFLILYGIIALFILGSLFYLVFFDKMIGGQKNFADERIIYGIIAVLGLFFLWSFVLTGLSTGSSLFSMADVGLLFVAPISSKKILLYGLISTLGKALLGSVFIFYQISNLKTNFGYGLKEIIGLFLMFSIMLLFCQLMSIGIYILTNGNQTRKKIVNGILYSAFVLLAGAIILTQKQTGVGMFEAALRVLSSDWYGYVPVTGWSAMFFIGLTKGSLATALIPILLYLIFAIIILSLLTTGKADYYEDVLLSTEFTYNTQKAAKEGGNIQTQSRKKIKVKDNEVGINKGRGAGAIFHRQLLEMRRQSKFFYIDGYTIFTVGICGILGYNFRKNGVPSEAVYGVLGTFVYFQYFLTTLGRLRTELIKPYIYLLPESSFKKVVAASITSLLKPCVDGALMFGVFILLGGTDFLTGLFCALAYASSGAMYVGMTILFQRVLGGQPNKIIKAFLGMFLFLITLAPGVGASVAAAFLLPEALRFLCTLPFTIFCLLFGAVMFIACGNLIDKAEYTGSYF